MLFVSSINKEHLKIQTHTASDPGFAVNSHLLVGQKDEAVERIKTLYPRYRLPIIADISADACLK